MGSNTVSPAIRETYALVTVVTVPKTSVGAVAGPEFLEYEVVDVFAPRAFTGNPLAVVFDADGLTTEQCQALANEFHLSETSFISAPTESGADYRVMRAESGEAAVEALPELKRRNETVALFLVDQRMPGMSGIDGIRLIKERSPETHVIMLTMFDDHDKVFRSICAGASGYMLKTSPKDKITEGIREVVNGGAPMNAQIAKSVLQMFAKMGATAPVKMEILPEAHHEHPAGPTLLCTIAGAGFIWLVVGVAA